MGAEKKPVCEWVVKTGVCESVGDETATTYGTKSTFCNFELCRQQFPANGGTRPALHTYVALGSGYRAGTGSLLIFALG